MKCPKDASDVRNQDWNEGCQSKIPNDKKSNPELHSEIMMCTRDLNHKGLHHHHAMKGKCCRTWTTTEAVIEAL